MEFVFSSEPMIAYAYAGLAIVSLLTLFMLAWIVFLRVRLYLDQRHQSHFQAVWLPIFTETAMHSASHKKAGGLPPLPRRDFFLFIHNWLGFQENLSGQGLVRMNGLARRLRVQDYARRFLHKRSLRRRLAAVMFLGTLRDRSSWAALETLLSHENSLLSILAARSLLKIDQERALPLVLAQLVRRDDWPETRVAVLLRSVLTAEVATTPLFAALRNSTDSEALRLLPYVEHMFNEERNQILRILLERSRSDRLTSRILKYIQCSHELDLVRQHVGHSRWHIRMQAVAALGRIGKREDIPLLLQHLGDAQWWVRYRAAQALLKIPGMSRQELAVIHDNLEDSFARTMLEQVLIEEGGQG